MNLFGADGFMPHGFCLEWNPQLVALLVASNFIIALAYYSIPVTLLYIVFKRKIQFSWVFWMFSAFILLCGTTHIMGIVTIWKGTYWLEAMINVATALVSLLTAIMLWPLVPAIFALLDAAGKREHIKKDDSVPAKNPMIAGLVTGMLAIALIGAGVYQQSVSVFESRALVFHTQDACSALSELRSSLKDAETGQRGFIITGEEDYLEPYEDRIKSIPAAFKLAQDSTDDSAVQRALLKRLGTLIDQKIAELKETVSVRRRLGFKAAAQIVETGRGQALMDEIRTVVDTMMANETRLLAQRRSELEAKTNHYFAAFVILAIASMVMFSAFGYFMSRYLTDLRTIYGDLTEYKDRLEEFYAVLLHELRTPLTSIRGSLGLMAGGKAGPLSNRATQLVKISHSETERMLRLINELLDLKKVEEGRFDLNLAVVEPSELISKTIDGIQGMAQEAKVEIVRPEHVEPSKLLSCDADLIVQALTNLLSNAIKFSAPNTSVELFVDTNPSEIKFSVKDQGPGIPKEQRYKVFQRFQHVDGVHSTYRGTGLGLTISKAIADKHGGKMGFESEPGRGSTCWLSLPLSKLAIA